MNPPAVLAPPQQQQFMQMQMQPKPKGPKTAMIVVIVVVSLLVIGGGFLYFYLSSKKKSSSSSGDKPKSSLTSRLKRSNMRLQAPSSWSTMPAELHAKAEESFHRIGAHYMEQGLSHEEAQTKAASDVEQYIRSVIAKRMNENAAAESAKKEVRFNDVVKVNPAEVDGMVSNGPSKARGGSAAHAAHNDDGSEDRMATMRPKQRAAMETARAAEELMNEREPSGPRMHEGRPMESSRSDQEHDDGFTPL